MRKTYKVGVDLTGSQQPNRLIQNPNTATDIFGYFPACSTKGKDFPAGPIRLKEGRHRGQNNGFGVKHIWAEHYKSELDAVNAEALIIKQVLAILDCGSIYYEGGTGPHANRALIWRSSNGLLVLEEKQDGQNNTYYSVVTVFTGKGPKGVQIGSIKN